jgi:hypothetical protein
VTNTAPYRLAIGGFCRVDSRTTYMYCPATDPQGILPEQFTVHALGLPDGSTVPTGTPFKLRSVQTLQYCRVVPVGARQQIQCNVDVSAASDFTYSTAGFAHQGRGIVNPGGSQPVYMGSAATGTPGTAVPAGLSTCGDLLSGLRSAPPGSPRALVSPGENYQLTLTKAGSLKILERATGACMWDVGPFSSCRGPYSFEMLPCGTLALKQGNGSLVWSSSSCCLGTGCHSASLREDGALVITDSLGQVVWSSFDYKARGTEAGKPAARMLQLHSNGHPRVSCLNASPSLPSASLVSSNKSGAVLMQLDKGGGLQVRGGATGATSKKTSGSTSTAASQLCLLSNGQLQLSSRPVSGAAQAAWRSAMLQGALARSGAPFTARLSPTGCVQVLDSVCNLVATECSIGSSSSEGTGGPSGKPAAAPPPVRRRHAPPRPPPSRLVSGTPAPPSPHSSSGSSSKPSLPDASSGAPQTGCKPVLAVGRLCGGVNLCGNDAPCVAETGLCCEAGTQCIRRNVFMWMCVH